MLFRTLSLALILALQVLSSASSASPPAFFGGTPPHLLAHRAALVVGVGPYSPLRPLPNAENDAKDVSDGLSKLGFDDVTLDLESVQVGSTGYTSLKHRINDLVDDVRQNHGVLFFYFAGHGVTQDGQSYILPIDANIQRPEDVQSDGIPVAWLLSRVQAANADIAIIVIDACRDNPFAFPANPFEESLSEKAPTKLEVPDHAMLVYSTTQGAVAADGDDASNSPFAHVLVAEIGERSTAPELFNSIGMALTGMQAPRTYGGLNADFRFMMTSDDYSRESDLFAATQKMGTPSAFQIFRHQYPTGYFAADADAQAKLLAEQAEQKALEQLWKVKRELGAAITTVRANQDVTAWASPIPGAGPLPNKIKTGQSFFKIGETNGLTALLRADGKTVYVADRPQLLRAVAPLSMGTISLSDRDQADISKESASLGGRISQALSGQGGEGHVTIQSSIPVNATGDQFDKSFLESMSFASALKSAGVDPAKITFAPPTRDNDLAIKVSAISSHSGAQAERH